MKSTPEHGDLIVHRDHKNGGSVYVLHTASGPAQLVFRSRDDAVQQAAWIASRKQVRVWLAGAVGFELLKDFRSTEAPVERHE